VTSALSDNLISKKECTRTSAYCRDVCRSEFGADSELHSKTAASNRPFPNCGHNDPSKLPPGSILHNHEGASGLHRVSSEGSVLPILPVGFYQYSIDGDHDARLMTDEAIYGMSLTAPYASTASPDAAWFTKMEEFLDRAHAIGYMVHYQLIAFELADNSPEVLANITAQVNKFKDHPAIFGWYLADEPDGQGIPLDLLQPKYDLIRSLDQNHPVSMVFCAGGAADFISALDLTMVDPYPIPGAHAATVQDSLAQVAALGKPIMMVPQSFGGGENWARGPSIREERLMTYIGLLNDVVAIQYFVRSAPVGFPYAPNAWSEIRKISSEIQTLVPALAGGSRLADIKADVEHINVGAWTDRDGSIVVVVANVGQNGLTQDSASFTVDIPFSSFRDVAVTSMFEDNEAVAFSQDGAGKVTIKDYLRGMDARAYRIERVAAPKRSFVRGASGLNVREGNMVYNPSYETAVCPGVADGNYVGNSKTGEDAAMFFADPRDSVDGRSSLRLVTPSVGAGLSLSPYTLPKLDGGAKYKFSVWLKGAKGGEVVQFSFAKSIFAVDDVNKFAATTEWQLVELTLTTVAEPACPYGCRSWTNYELVTAGTVWMDLLQVE
jgi:hypothetical protein